MTTKKKENEGGDVKTNGKVTNFVVTSTFSGTKSLTEIVETLIKSEIDQEAREAA